MFSWAHVGQELKAIESEHLLNAPAPVVVFLSLIGVIDEMRVCGSQSSQADHTNGSFCLVCLKTPPLCGGVSPTIGRRT